jgi:glycosyltransferase involved in cell wall biosynthesis
MSRLAERCRVIYVNPAEIVNDPVELRLEEREGAAGVRVLQPIFPNDVLDTPGNHFPDLWRKLLPRVLAEAGPNTVLWISSPLLNYLVEAALPHVQFAVYDCMDDLASFRDGNDEMRQREAQVLQLVELVFTGGRSMYEARKTRHPRVHCFPSGVDIEHYGTVRDPALVEPPRTAFIPHPRLGYFGVLDERIDWPLIATIAYERPNWHWVLVGPTAKVHPSEIPGGLNLHYVGQQRYEQLPAFLKGFDIATMPFAMNEATRWISPTKTLEYLAGGKQVISSPVPDVVAGYSGIVTIAEGVAAWIAAIEKLLAATPEEQQAQLERAAPLLEAGSWDGIAERMWALIDERLARSQHTLRIHQRVTSAG